MKKSLIIITSLALVFVFGFAFVGCKKTNKKSSNSTESVISNGGMAVKKDNVLYFVDSASDNATIYKVETDESGNFTSQPTVLVKNVVANENGSIHIFGDYLYYVSSSTDRVASGATQTGILKFYRVSLSGGKSKVLYTTQSSEETELKYAYYPSGDSDLFLVVYEKSQKTITSVNIGTNPTKSVIASDVTGFVFAENGNRDGANAYVYYTHAKDKTLSNQTGNVVERINPDGSNKKTVSTKDVTYSLISITDGKLIYSDASYIFASSGETLSNEDKVLSYLPSSTYKQIKYFGNKLVVLAKVNATSTATYALWVLEYDANGNMQKTVVNSSMSEDAEFLFTNENKLFYTLEGKVYAIELAETKVGQMLTDTTVDDILGYIAPEVIGDYFYFMHTEDDGTAKIRRVKTTGGVVENADYLA